MVAVEFEMVKVCSGDFLEYLVKLFIPMSTWDSRSIPQDWNDALLILVPNKGIRHSVISGMTPAV